MKVLAVFTFLSMLGFAGSLARGSTSIGKGSYAPCAVLEGISSSGARLDRCIREGELEGQGLTLIKFFSASCSDCLYLHKKMVDAFSTGDIPKKVKFNLVGIDRDNNLLREYARNEKANMLKLGSTVFIDSDRDAKSAYGVRLVPAVYVLDNTTNTVIYHYAGVPSESEFHTLTQLLENY